MAAYCCPVGKVLIAVSPITPHNWIDFRVGACSASVRILYGIWLGKWRHIQANCRFRCVKSEIRLVSSPIWQDSYNVGDGGKGIEPLLSNINIGYLAKRDKSHSGRSPLVQIPSYPWHRVEQAIINYFLCQLQCIFSLDVYPFPEHIAPLAQLHHACQTHLLDSLDTVAPSQTMRSQRKLQWLAAQSLGAINMYYHYRLLYFQSSSVSLTRNYIGVVRLTWRVQRYCSSNV